MGGALEAETWACVPTMRRMATARSTTLVSTDRVSTRPANHERWRGPGRPRRSARAHALEASLR